MITEKRRKPCPRCNGNAEISPDPRDPMSPWYSCPDCDGTGHTLEPASLPTFDARQATADRLERIAYGDEPLPF